MVKRVVASLYLILLGTAAIAGRKDQDHSDCQQLLVRNVHLVHVDQSGNDEIACARGLLCRGKGHEKAYARTPIIPLWDRVTKHTEVCLANDGACALYTNFTLGYMASIYGCMCQEFVLLPRVYKTKIYDWNDILQDCPLVNITQRFQERGLPKPEVYRDHVSCYAPPDNDNETCTCNHLEGGVPTTVHGNPCSNIWNIV
ncbi:hypothetical protein BCR37DRAFT_115182 [Protomyces lactucae-debilis]|uniref:Uncharacterized protein n=1 Tax=Protomyces lactucae-debilis TaxID=2754530 RepID=A0A1Y2F2Q3_PROLT|nr:uncharacterized protein BCR37DRAFT_115182 [Protomyces lactucae-debilis]ORY78170.1 hypothetical protein BCR37DRAFT_115182 [Protomyces lactucae-debilis]